MFGLTVSLLFGNKLIHEEICAMRGVRGRGPVRWSISVSVMAVLLVFSMPVTAQQTGSTAKDGGGSAASQPGQTAQPASQSKAVDGGNQAAVPAPTSDATGQAPAVKKEASAQPASRAMAPVVKGRPQRPAGPQESSTTELKLRQLATLVEDLKNRVTAIRNRLNLMKEMLVEEQSAIGGAKIVIKHINKMGGSFKMIKLRYFLNGQLLQSYNAANSRDEAVLSKRTISIPVGLVSPGNMKLKVFITYQGNGYGIFRYVRNWTWEVSAEHTFSIEAGKAYTLEVIGYEKGNFNTPLKDRPAIKFRVRTQPLVTTKSNSKGTGKSTKGGK